MTNEYPSKVFLYTFVLIILSGFNIAFAQAPNISYPISAASYPVNAAIKTLVPINSGGAVLAADNEQVTTFAGNGIPSNKDGIGMAAGFWGPLLTKTDVNGNIYVVDFPNIIRKISPAGVVNTFLTSFGNIQGLAIDASGNLFVSDINNNTINKITPDGVVSLYAGTRIGGSANGSLAYATFSRPSGLVFDSKGNLFVADYNNQQIRKIDKTGNVTTFAGMRGVAAFTDGKGNEARFFAPNALTIDKADNIYLVDNGHTIRKITPDAIVTTIIDETNPGTGTLSDLTVDNRGDIYATDELQNQIKKISPGGKVNIYAGAGAIGLANGSALEASFYGPQGITFNGLNNFYIGDTHNHIIRKISLTGYIIDKPLPLGLVFDQTTGIISGTPVTISPATQYAITAYNAAGTSTSLINITIKTDDVVPVINPPNISYPKPPASYPVNAIITPLKPSNSGGLVPATAYGKVTIIAGDGQQGSIDGIGAQARFTLPENILLDNSGNIYLTNNNKIRKITPDGTVSTIAGDGTYGANNGPGSTANFYDPAGITIDNSGNLYVADNSNSVIRKITPSGFVTTYAGKGGFGYSDGVANQAMFSRPYGITIDHAGNIYLTDDDNFMVRKITPNGDVSTIAGDGNPGFSNGIGKNAEFKFLSGIVIDKADNLYVSDEGNNMIRKITSSGIVSTYAGTGEVGAKDGPSSSATFQTPTGLAIDDLGNLYVADHNNFKLRKITPDGIVSTLPVNIGSSMGIAIDKSGNLFFADLPGNSFDKAILTGYVIDKPLPAGLTFDPTTGIITGTPITASPATQYTITAYNAGGSSQTVVTISVLNSIPPVQQPKITYPTPKTYTANTAIPPLTPANTGGAVPETFLGLAEVFAGNGNFGTSNGDPLMATFHFPTGTTIDGAGNLYVADYGNNLIRKINSAGITSTFAGSGTQGAANGTADIARFNNPTGVAIDASGNVYVADAGNNQIRMITTSGVVDNFAGNAIAGSSNGIGILASFNNPFGIAIDASGNLYVADMGNNLIRKITPAGVVTTLAGSGQKGSANGTGTAASFNAPEGIAVDMAGNVYIADSGNNLIREISPAGVVTTLAGNGSKGSANGANANASFNAPAGITVDVAGNIFIADTENNLIRMITPQGTVSTLAGSGAFGGFNNIGVLASFANPMGLTIDGNGNLFVADKFNNEVREVVTTGYNIDKALPQGLVFDRSTGIITGIPTTPTPTTIYTITAFNEGGNNSTTVSITVIAPQSNILPPLISYQTPLIYHVNMAVAALSPDNEGGPIPANNYSIDKPLPAGLNFDIVTGIISGVPTAASQATDYIITAFNAGGTNSFTINIQVIKDPSPQEVITFPAISTVTYGADDVDLGATSTNSGVPVTYTSSIPDIATIVNGKIHITGAGSSIITALQAGNDDYAAADPVKQTFTILKAPLVIAADNQTKAFGTANPPLTVTYTSFVYGENSAQLLTQPEISTTATTTSAPGDYTITVDGGTSNNYDIHTTDGVLTITSVIVIPNAFTPNGDGINDLWNISALIDFPQCMVSVYNRYGSMVYQSRGYTKPWDGTLNGTLVPTGTYYYIIDPKDGHKQLSGSVTVLH